MGYKRARARHGDWKGMRQEGSAVLHQLCVIVILLGSLSARAEDAIGDLIKNLDAENRPSAPAKPETSNGSTAKPAKPETAAAPAKPETPSSPEVSSQPASPSVGSASGGEGEPAPALPQAVPLPRPRPQFLGETGYPHLDQARHDGQPLSLLPFWYKYPWQKNTSPEAWTFQTVKALETHGKDLLEKVPADASMYCPRYEHLTREERMMFWTRLISLISERECSYDPSKTYKDVQVGPNVLSTGFLMLSLESAQMDVFDCDMINEQKDLLNWRKNLVCAVRIMNYYVARDGVIAMNTGDESKGEWRGLARYWGPFRDKRLGTSAGRTQLRKLISGQRAQWKKEGEGRLHPAYHDDDYAKAKETNLVRFYRLMNQMPFCQ